MNAAPLASQTKSDAAYPPLAKAMARADRLRLLDPQVAQQPVERLGVGVVLLPAGEVAGAVAPARSLPASTSKRMVAGKTD